MGFFTPKTWKQRIVEFPGRRRLDDTSTADVYDVFRAEGNVTQEGDGFTAVNMNGLEERIGEGFQAVEEVFGEAFSTEKSYSSGEYCIYENKLYKFTSSKSQGAWDAQKVSEVMISGELKSLASGLSELNQKIQNKIQYDVAENENRDLYLMFQRVTDVEFVNGVGYVNNNLSGGDRVVRAFAQPESVTGVVIASCQAQSANNRMELHCINIDDGTPYSGSTVGYINLFILVTKGS